MYNDAMRNMRDAFYDPGMHGLDWTGGHRDVPTRWCTRSSARRASLRDVLQQALGELSVLHVFVSIRSPTRRRCPVGEPSACLGGSLVAQAGTGHGGRPGVRHVRGARPRPTRR